ncbi:MAG: GNAT family N-acetyltransferase, partial [Candidatus Nanoarchaeia archaeon]
FKQLAELDKIWVKERISPGFIPRDTRDFKKDIKKAICFVAESNNKIVGYIFGKKRIFKKKKRPFFFKKNERYIDLDALYALKPYRKKKAGKMLIQALINEAKKQKFQSIDLVADNKQQKRIINFYKNNKFKIIFTRMKLNLK